MATLQTGLNAFRKDVSRTLEWLGATEALWMAAPPTTDIRKNLRVPQLELLYEAAYLRIFTAWEVFLEDVTIRMIANTKSPSYSPLAAAGKTLQSSLSAARTQLYEGADFLLWHNPDSVARRVAKFLVQSPVEVQILAEKDYLQRLANIRHRVAHSSDDSDRKFRDAATFFTGVAPGGVGKLLRSYDPSDSLNTKRWIFVFQAKLLDVSSAICS